MILSSNELSQKGPKRIQKEYFQLTNVLTCFMCFISSKRSTEECVCIKYTIKQNLLKYFPLITLPFFI